MRIALIIRLRTNSNASENNANQQQCDYDHITHHHHSTIITAPSSLHHHHCMLSMSTCDEGEQIGRLGEGVIPHRIVSVAIAGHNLSLLDEVAIAE